MATMPTPVAELLEKALVAELTVVDAKGRPVTYPLIPLYDGEHVYMTSSTLFSRKLQHIDANAKVAVSITDPVSVGGRTDRATIQGDARVIAEDPHGGWERLLPIWDYASATTRSLRSASNSKAPTFRPRLEATMVPRRSGRCAAIWSDNFRWAF